MPTVKLGVDIANPPSPMSPDVEDSDMEVVPPNVPEASVIAPDPLAEIVTTVPLAPAPSAMAPFPAVVDKPRVPVAVIVPLVVKSALLETETSSPVDEPDPILSVVPPEPTQVTSPVVLKVKLVVVPVSVVIAPDPDFKFNVVAVIEPPVWPIVPVPLAVNVTVVPLMLLPKLIAPSLPLETSESAPLEAKADVVVMLLSLVTDKLVNVSPDEARVIAPAPELVTVTAPIVFTVKPVVDVAKPPSPMSPDPEASDMDVLPDKVPVDCDIAPVVSALTVTTVPPAEAPRAMSPPLPPVVDKPRVPVAVIDPLVVKSALLETDTLSPVDEPAPIFSALPPEPTQVTSPVVLKVKLAVVPVSVVIAPDPEVKFKLVAVIEPVV